MRKKRSPFDYQKITNYFLIILAGLLIYSCGNPKIETTEKIDFGNNANAGKYIDSNGIKIYYESYGDITRPALILIHGNSGSIATMALQINYFKDNYYMIIGDNRSHGKSGDSPNVTYDQMAEDYIAIMDDLDIQSANVLGQSDGGIIGLLMAINYPERITKLVSAVPNLKPGPEAIVDWELELSSGYRHLIDSMIKINDNSRDWHRQKSHMDLMAYQPNIPISDLAKITCPVLVMTSDNDIIKPRHILEIYENIPHGQLFIMPGATHFMIRDEHELFNSIANRFLSEPFKRPSSKEIVLKIINRNQQN